jgi:hypothetical protein
VSKVEDYRRELRERFDWEPFLLERSGCRVRARTSNS